MVVVMHALVLDGENIQHFQAFALDGLAQAVVDELLLQLRLDIRAETLHDGGDRGFSWAEAWETDLAGIVAHDGVALFADFFPGHADVSHGTAVRLVFDVDVHEKAG